MAASGSEAHARPGKGGGEMLDEIIPGDLQSGSPARTTARVNLFMAAILHSAGEEIAVKIRDLSASGAQVEGVQLLETGTEIMLSRGQLSVRGHVAWCNERRCGLEFASKITVQSWMANPTNRHQERVDQIVNAVKAGVAPAVSATPGATASSIGVGQDLERAAELLGNFGDTLAGDSAIVARHGAALQHLEIVIQTLTALAEAPQSGSPADAARLNRLNRLRASCAEALRSGD